MVKWNEVTWYSRLGALVLFVGVVPALCFYIGIQYQQTVSPTSQRVTLAPTSAPQAADSSLAGGGGSPDCVGIYGPEFATCTAEAESAMAEKVQNAYEQELQKINTLPSTDFTDSYPRKDVYQATVSSQSAWKKYVEAECGAEQLVSAGGADFETAFSWCYIGEGQKRVAQLQSKFY